MKKLSCLLTLVPMPYPLAAWVCLFRSVCSDGRSSLPLCGPAPPAGER